MDEFLDLPHFSGPTYDRTVLAYMRDKYASHPPAVIVAAGDAALRFLLDHRAEFCPRVPIVHVAVWRATLSTMQPLPPDVIGVPAELEFARNIELALRWHPLARRLVIVTGASEQDRGWEARLRQQVARFTDRATPEFLAGLPTGSLLERLRALGDGAVVFTPGYYQDGDGRFFSPRASVEAIAAASTAPVYGPSSTYLGTGMVGGYVLDFVAMGRQGGQFATALLAGVAPASLSMPPMAAPLLSVDWRQVRRWGIDEHALPRDTVVRFRTPTFIEAYRNAAIGAAVVLLLQTGLIGWLLLERRRRHRAEFTVQSSRSELAHASRLAVAGELTGAIAHEVNQPLCAIYASADAAAMILESGAERRDVVLKLLDDIRRDDLRASEVLHRLRTLLAKHEVEWQRFDFNDALLDADLVLQSEASRRRVTVDVRPASLPAAMVGDRVQIQQVILNLVFNAMEAVAHLDEPRRAIGVQVETRASRITVTVRDHGEGIAPEHLPKLFESFFTTKDTGMGLGLSIARTLVEAHRGRIWAEHGVPDGAVFVVELPAAIDADDATTRSA